MSTYNLSKYIVYKDKSTGKLINSSLIDKTKLMKVFQKDLLRLKKPEIQILFILMLIIGMDIQ
jgi:hypothetical protein